MKYKLFNEITLSIILAALAVLFLDPFMIWMPTELVYMLIGGVIIIFTVFAGLMWREQAKDEREELHKLAAGRIGYIAGGSILTVGIVYQTFFIHSVDVWLVATLAAMVIGKLFGLLYGRIHN